MVTRRQLNVSGTAHARSALTGGGSIPFQARAMSRCGDPVAFVPFGAAPAEPSRATLWPRRVTVKANDDG